MKKKLSASHLTAEVVQVNMIFLLWDNFGGYFHVSVFLC